MWQTVGMAAATVAVVRIAARLVAADAVAKAMEPVVDEMAAGSARRVVGFATGGGRDEAAVEQTGSWLRVD